MLAQACQSGDVRYAPQSLERQLTRAPLLVQAEALH